MERYHYTQCGLDNVYLKDGFHITRTSKGNVVSIENPRGLEKAIADSLASLDRRLSARELRFMRTHLGYSQSKLAELLQVSTIAVKKWESGENPLPGTTDTVIKTMFKEREQNMAALFEVLENRGSGDQETDSNDLEFCVAQNGQDWSHDGKLCG